MKESLSAMMDAQLSESEQAHLLTELSRNTELRKTWERYHLIRAVLNKELGSVVLTGLADEIARRIRELPASIASRTGPTRSWKPLGKWLGSVALAASVAAVAIFGVRWFTMSDTRVAPQVVSQGEETSPGTHWDATKPEVAKALNVYLVQHNEFTPTSSVNGVISYVRVVGYDNDE